MQEQLIQNKPHELIINEIFHSIQGESSHMGCPCVFVRLTYCNIRCSYCDTAYAFYEGREMTIAEVMEIVQSYQCKLVEITGGEPLFQTNVHELMKQLCDQGFEVLIETGGSLDISHIDSRVKRIIDFKCPSSNMTKMNFWDNVSHLKAGDEVKFVIGNREDYEWSKQMILDHQINQRCSILMAVVFNGLEPVRLAEWILEDKLNVRFQLQMHKYIWSPETKGV